MKRIWVGSSVAKKWKEGCVVIQKRVYAFGPRYELHPWFRPDWVESDSGYGISRRSGARKVFFMRIDPKTLDKS
jgi:hypothetical protein